MLVTPAGHPSAQTPAAPGCSPRHGHPFAAGTEVQCDEEALCVQAWDSTLCPPAPGIRCIYIHTCPIAGRRETATFQTDVCPRLLTLSSASMKPSILACMKLAMLLWKRALEKDRHPQVWPKLTPVVRLTCSHGGRHSPARFLMLSPVSELFKGWGQTLTLASEQWAPWMVPTDGSTRDAAERQIWTVGTIKQSVRVQTGPRSPSKPWDSRSRMRTGWDCVSTYFATCPPCS